MSAFLHVVSVQVEMLVNDFVRLTEVRGLWAEDEGSGGGLGELLGDDDETYALPGGSQGECEVTLVSHTCLGGDGLVLGGSGLLWAVGWFTRCMVGHRVGG